MQYSTTNSSNRRDSLAKRLVACMVAVLLVGSLQLVPTGSAIAAESGSGKAGKSDQSESLTASKNNEKKKSSEKKKKKDEKSKEEEEREAAEKEADKKHDEADRIFGQVSAMGATLSEAQAEYDAAQSELDRIAEQRNEANGRLAAESARLESLQNELSTFVINMYKQGGVTPYLDVLLRASSYREFLTSWSALTEIYEQGESLAAEKRQIQKEIESELASYEEQAKQAERSRAIADSKRKQIKATQLSLTVQACTLNVEAAEILEDEDEIEEAEAELEEAQEALDEAILEGLAGENVQIGDGLFTNPCPGGTVSSGFGYRDFDHAVHKGVDLAAPEGTPYYAAESGTVTAATNGGGDNGGAGNWIVIDHGDGLVTKYMHSLVTFVSVGDRVERGQNIGLVGSTGNSTGPHLHFQVEANGTAVDPTPFLKEKE